MSEAEEMASIVRGWLDLLRNPQRIEASRAALAKALTLAREEGRMEGFEKAREMAAGLMDAAADRYLHGSRGRSVAEDGAKDIRAMRDGAAKSTAHSAMCEAPANGRCTCEGSR